LRFQPALAQSPYFRAAMPVQSSRQSAQWRALRSRQVSCVAWVISLVGARIAEGEAHGVPQGATISPPPPELNPISSRSALAGRPLALARRASDFPDCVDEARLAVFLWKQRTRFIR